MRVVLVHGVVREHERHVEHSGQTQAVTQKERMVRMDDVRSEDLNGGAEPARGDQHDREVAAVEALDRGTRTTFGSCFGAFSNSGQTTRT